MSKHFKKTLFIFRRDFRLEDNLGLLSLLEQSEEVVLAFVFDERQMDPDKNDYFSAPAFQFLLNSLAELDDVIKNRGATLNIFLGEPAAVVCSLIAKDKIEAVFVNKDYTPFSRKRDKEIADICNKYGVVFERHEDATLSPIEEIRTGTGNLYAVFTPFMRKAMTHEVPKPRKNNFSNYYADSLKTKTIALHTIKVDIGERELILKGGRREALSILKDSQHLKNYKDRRNIPSDQGTSRLSAHHKFGTISIRESYYIAVANVGCVSDFVSQLYWRDFYYYISYHFPIVFKQSFLPWSKYITWVNNKNNFKAWCEGKTGVPMVDAGMRELKHSGWMHNRVRMVVASYLTKNLLIDWRWGEKYFAQNLIDYDPAQNNGGWQWSASTGADPRPLRIFNPYTQAEKHDPHAEYIKKWVPEMQEVDIKKLTDGKTQDFSKLASGYPAPLIDQKESYHRTMSVYRAAKSEWRSTRKD